jgi:DNA replication protein DnaC
MLANIKESGLNVGKSISTFNFSHTPSINKTHVQALRSGDMWIKQGGNVLIFGPSGVGKTHLATNCG